MPALDDSPTSPPPPNARALAVQAAKPRPVHFTPDFTILLLLLFLPMKTSPFLFTLSSSDAPTVDGGEMEGQTDALRQLTLIS